MGEKLPVYEILAVKYAGPFARPLAKMLWNSTVEEQVSVNYYVWVVRGGGRDVVVDCGVGEEAARKACLDPYERPDQALSRAGVDAARVETVVVTHMHWDHINGAPLFPNARFYVQKREFEFWAKDPMAKKPPFAMLADPVGCGYLAGLECTDRLALADGDSEIGPGLELLLAPGHTPGLQALRVHTADGWAILGSDCGHIFRNYRESIPSWYITDMVAWMRSYDKLKALAASPELLFPGHDGAMLTNYPRVAEGVTRLV